MDDNFLGDFTGFGLQKQDKNVTEKRNVYVGGSDVPTILGINSYKTQYELALEKTGLVEREFVTNEYIKFGNLLEPQIREYINLVEEIYFEEETYIDNIQAIRSNVDGISKEENILLEIKTHGKNPTMQVYEVQMQLYMYQSGADHGWLALYERPKNFDVEFNADNLKIKNIERDEQLIKKILDSIETFWIRCEYLKDNPEMDEQTFMSHGTDVDKAIAKLDDMTPALIEAKNYIKEMEAKEKELKDFLYANMEKNDIKKIETDRLVVTRILPTKTKRFDSKTFKEDYPDLHSEYTKEGNRKGYIRIQEVIK